MLTPKPTISKDELIHFNGVKVLLTTGREPREVQNYFDEADLVISIYPDLIPPILKNRCA